MFRPGLRSAPRLLRVGRPPLSAPRRLLSTSPSPRPRTWKGSAVRWGVAIAAVYWYNTSPIFADEPAPRTIPPPPTFADDDRQTVDAVIEEKRRKAAATAPPINAPEMNEAAPAQTAEATTAPTSIGSPAALEEEADQQGAFNPETGEINWDCPCLGGMADGPCGEEFKTAFSCFVFSKEEPKGMDCIDKFQGMQECFKKYPEIYGSELTEDDADEGEAGGDNTSAPPVSPDSSDGATATAASEATGAAAAAASMGTKTVEESAPHPQMAGEPPNSAEAGERQTGQAATKEQ